MFPSTLKKSGSEARTTEYIIKNVLENPDQRTLKKYLKCIKDYAERSSGIKINVYQT
jgi:hypothetical protein